MPSVPNNYWDKIQADAEKYNLDPMQYLDNKNIYLDLPERIQEHKAVMDGCSQYLMKKCIEELLNRTKKNSMRLPSLKDIKEKFMRILSINPTRSEEKERS